MFIKVVFYQEWVALGDSTPTLLLSIWQAALPSQTIGISVSPYRNRRDLYRKVASRLVVTLFSNFSRITEQIDLLLASVSQHLAVIVHLSAIVS